MPPTDLRDQLQSSLGTAYRIERELPAGGMARVFTATDLGLGREIAVKVLPIDLASGVSVERFQREIRTAARLQHPHIVPLLSAGDAGGLPFYTMPFVKGETLRERVTRGGELSISETVHILRDVAAALAYAHAEGVIHRDIKPENVLMSGGVAVVTDFGVAKAMDAATTGGGHSLTSMGVALGTPAYMAPEQASADPRIDHRADIYSFGCLAYELLTGASPFAGRPPQQMLAAHVTDAPEALSKRRPATPAALAALVMRCLEKRPGDRPQSATDLLAALDAIGTPSGGSQPTGAIAARRRRRVAGAIVASTAVLGLVIWFVVRLPAPAPSLMALSTAPVAVTPDLERNPSISPDGRLVAYVANTSRGDRIFVKQIDGGRANLLTDEVASNQNHPAFSPDNSQIAFSSANSIYIVPSLGGAPRRVIDSGASPAWSPDGRDLLYIERGRVWRRAVAGGTPRALARGDVAALSPDGRFLAFGSGSALTLATSGPAGYG